MSPSFSQSFNWKSWINLDPSLVSNTNPFQLPNPVHSWFVSSRSRVNILHVKLESKLDTGLEGFLWALPHRGHNTLLSGGVAHLQRGLMGSVMKHVQNNQVILIHLLWGLALFYVHSPSPFWFLISSVAGKFLGTKSRDLKKCCNSVLSLAKSINL